MTTRVECMWLPPAREKVQVAASSRLLQARATAPLKLSVSTALTMAVIDDPAATVSRGGGAEAVGRGGVGLVLTATRRPRFRWREAGGEVEGVEAAGGGGGGAVGKTSQRLTLETVLPALSSNSSRHTTAFVH